MYVYVYTHLSKAQPGSFLLSVSDSRRGVVHVTLWGIEYTQEDKNKQLQALNKVIQNKKGLFDDLFKWKWS